MFFGIYYPLYFKLIDCLESLIEWYSHNRVLDVLQRYFFLNIFLQSLIQLGQKK